MPLLRSHQHEEPVEVPPQRKGSIFSSRSHETPEHTSTKSHGFFGSNRRSPTSSNSDLSGASHKGSFFFSSNPTVRNDPVISAGRQKVIDAETAEKAADKALNAARIAVRDAKNHVRQLERDALEE